MRISDLTDFSIEIDGYYPARSRELFVTTNVKNNATMHKEFFDLANRTVQDIQDVKNLVYSLGYQPLLVLPQTVIGLSQTAVTAQVSKRATATL